MRPWIEGLGVTNVPMSAPMQLEQLWQEFVLAQQNEELLKLQEIVDTARKIDGQDATDWHEQALQLEEKKWFVAYIYGYKPVPKRLAKPFLLAALMVKDASYNRAFIQPVLETYGTEKTKKLLFELCETNELPADARSKALYWVEATPQKHRGS